MSIRLDRKKMLTVSFFLCCIVPTLFPWFHAGPAQALRGIQLLGPLFIVGAVLYLYAMFAKRCRHVLVLGGLAHGVIFVAYLISFFQFPVVHHGFVGRLDASQPSSGSAVSFWPPIWCCSSPQRLLPGGAWKNGGPQHSSICRIRKKSCTEHPYRTFLFSVCYSASPKNFSWTARTAGTASSSSMRTDTRISLVLIIWMLMLAS